MDLAIFPENIQLEAARCPLGCPAGDEFVTFGYDRLHHIRGRFQVVKCSTCGLMWTNPRPTIETICEYYPEDYDPYLKTPPDRSSERLVKHLALQFLNIERIPPLQPGVMLEFGCSSGKFLNWMTHKGWKVTGIEVSEKAAKAAQALGHTVHVCALEEAPQPPQNYDLVVGWNVVEHLHDPIKALGKVWNYTKPGGWLVISMPNAASLEFILFKDAWYALDLPRHLYHFTPKTLTQLLNSCGWNVRKISHQITLANFAGSLGYLLEDSIYAARLKGLIRQLLNFHSSSSLHLLTFPIALPLAWLGQTGRITVWAQKTP